MNPRVQHSRWPTTEGSRATLSSAPLHAPLSSSVRRLYRSDFQSMSARDQLASTTLEAVATERRRLSCSLVAHSASGDSRYTVNAHVCPQLSPVRTPTAMYRDQAVTVFPEESPSSLQSCLIISKESSAVPAADVWTLCSYTTAYTTLFEFGQWP